VSKVAIWPPGLNVYCRPPGDITPPQSIFLSRQVAIEMSKMTPVFFLLSPRLSPFDYNYRQKRYIDKKKSTECD
jgi:hypothetical protein